MPLPTRLQRYCDPASLVSNKAVNSLVIVDCDHFKLIFALNVHLKFWLFVLLCCGLLKVPIDLKLTSCNKRVSMDGLSGRHICMNLLAL